MMVSVQSAARRPESDRLRMAVPKGALWQDSLDALSAAGIEVGGLADPGRQLIFETDDMEFVIGKPSDIPAYVAYGAVDVGIVGQGCAGRDTSSTSSRWSIWALERAVSSLQSSRRSTRVSRSTIVTSA